MGASHRSLLLQRSRSCLMVTVAALGLLRPAQAADSFEGPVIPGEFAAASFDIDGKPDAILVAWWNGAVVRSGLLYPRDGRFVVFPNLTPPGGVATNVAVGPAGTSGNRRAIVAWVGAQLDLDLAVLDDLGAVRSPPRTIGKAVQVVPLVIEGIDSGALLGYAWDSNPYWDPRVVELDLAGEVLDDETVQDALGPEQTLGVSIPATPEGTRAPVWIVSDTHSARIRRYAPDGDPLDIVAVELYDAAGPDYRPHAAVVRPPTGDPFAWIAVPSVGAGQPVDVAFARTPFDDDTVTLGPTLAQLAPRFVSGFVSFATLAGAPPYAVVLWEEWELDEDCYCSNPPPVRVDHVAQLLRVSDTLEAVGEPFLAASWREGDAEEPPLVGTARLSVSTRERGRFTVLWTNGRLGYSTIPVFGPAVVDASSTPEGTLLRWQPVPGAVLFDVVRGDLDNLLAGDLIHLGPLACIEAGSLDATTEGYEDMETPAPGRTFFYLVESWLDDGTRSLGTGSSGTPRVPGPGGCR